MIKYKYKEKTYAEDILENGFTTNYVSYELKILVKYFKNQEKSPKERESLIYDFCKKHLEGFSRVLHYKMINSVLNYGKKKESVLVEIPSVSVTKKELELIDNVNLDQDHKKILFTLLVLNKLNKIEYIMKKGNVAKEEHYFGGKQTYYTDLKKRANVPTYRRKNEKNVNEIIFDLSNEGLITPVSRGVIKLQYIYDMPKDDTVAMEVKHYEDIGHYYDIHVGIDKMKHCESCDIPIKVKSNRTKYCHDCFKKNRKEYKAEKERFYRKSKNVDN